MRNLGVFIDNVLVGTLHDTDPLSFTYTQDCLSGLVECTILRTYSAEAGTDLDDGSRVILREPAAGRRRKNAAASQIPRHDRVWHAVKSGWRHRRIRRYSPGRTKPAAG